MSATTKKYVTPQAVDVLAGRSVQAFQHKGNKMLRFRIVHNLEDFKNCPSRKQKTEVIRRVLEQVTAEDGRFLRYDKDTHQWFDAGLKEAHAKIASNFRDAVVPNKVKCLSPIKKKVLSAKLKSLSPEDQEETYGESLKPQPPLPMPTRALAERTLLKFSDRCFSRDELFLSKDRDIFEGHSPVLTEDYVSVWPGKSFSHLGQGGSCNLHQHFDTTTSLYEHLNSALAFEMSKQGNPYHRQELESAKRTTDEDGTTEGMLCPLAAGDILAADFLGEFPDNDLDMDHFSWEEAIAL